MPYYPKKRPSFLIGVARILDITISLRSYKKPFGHNSEYEDFYAIYSDWKTVGNDLKDAMGSSYLLSK